MKNETMRKFSPTIEYLAITHTVTMDFRDITATKISDNSTQFAGIYTQTVSDGERAIDSIWNRHSFIFTENKGCNDPNNSISYNENTVVTQITWYYENGTTFSQLSEIYSDVYVYAKSDSIYNNQIIFNQKNYLALKHDTVYCLDTLSKDKQSMDKFYLSLVNTNRFRIISTCDTPVGTANKGRISIGGIHVYY